MISESARRIVERLLDHMEEKSEPPRSVDITEAGIVTGWIVQRTRNDGRNVYEIWTPSERNASVPWAVGPLAPRSLSRPYAWKYLREHWRESARAFLGVAGMRPRRPTGASDGEDQESDPAPHGTRAPPTSVVLMLGVLRDPGIQRIVERTGWPFTPRGFV